MSYLLDTNILSEMRKREPSPEVAAWIRSTPLDQLYVSVLTLGEIQQGIVRIIGRGDREQARVLARWLAGIILGFADRIAPVTLRVASEWGRHPPAQSVPLIDDLLAATAKVHDWTVVTRNTRDFAHTGARVLNPFASVTGREPAGPAV